MAQDLTQQCLVHVTVKIMCDGVEFRGGKTFIGREAACTFLELIQDRFMHFIQLYNWDCSEDKDDEDNLTWFTIHHVGVIDPKQFSVEGWVVDNYFHL